MHFPAVVSIAFGREYEFVQFLVMNIQILFSSVVVCSVFEAHLDVTRVLFVSDVVFCV